MNKTENDNKLLILFIILTVISGGGFFPVLFIYVLFKYVLNADSKKTTNTKPQKTERFYTQKEKEEINQCLKEHFKTNDRLIITGDISLRPQKGRYTNLRDLYVYQGEDCISALDEFKRKYNDMYEQVMDLMIQYANLPKSEKIVVQKEEPVKETKEEQTKIEYTNCSDYIDRINALNTEIEQEEITNGLYQVCAYLKQIEMIEQNFPKSHDKLTKVYQYYLPILVGILEDYKQLSGSAKSHEEFQQAEDKLIKTIILINEALKTITTTICQEEFMSLNANMSTLEMLLRKDGLIDENPFAKEVSTNGK
ncbi:MAG: hypothetical protein PUF50_01320 [Erysipelotrichaceae bacterium]|nr:hypothetical protein [Erysipelotrichaceae bacterium]